MPVPTDYDGDGQTDVAVFRRATGEWWVKFSSGRSRDGQFKIKQWGAFSDVPIAADYDGDGLCDFAVWRLGVWFLWQSASNSFRVETWGPSALPDADYLAPGDYDGDGRADVVFWQARENLWQVRCSADGQVIRQVQGATGALPVRLKF